MHPSAVGWPLRLQLTLTSGVCSALPWFALRGALARPLGWLLWLSCAAAASWLCSGLLLRRQRARDGAAAAAIAHSAAAVLDSVDASREQRLHAILIQAPDPYLCIDGAGRLLGWNLAAATAFGWSRDEVIGLSLQELLLRPQDLRRFAALLRLMGRRGSRFTGFQRLEMTVRRRDGQLLPLEISANVVTSPDGRFLSAFARDITERQRSQRELAAAEHQLRSIANHLPVLIGHIDAQQRFRFINTTYEQTIGCRAGEVLGKTLQEVLEPGRYAEAEPLVRAALRGERQQAEYQAQQRDGTVHHYAMDYLPDVAADGSVQGYFTLVADITAHKTAELQLARRELQLRTLIDNLPVLISYVDRDLQVQFCNEHHRTLGLAPERLTGRRVADGIGEAGYAAQMARFEQALEGHEVSFESEVTRDGITRHFRSTFLPDRLADGSVAGVFNLTMEQTAQKQIELQLGHLARFDFLTGLPNRLQLDQTMKQAVERSRRSGQGLVLMFVDVDHFKSINDRHGHAVGDLVLQAVAQRLRAQVRATDTVARLAGDEFVILLEGAQGDDDATRVAQKLLQAVAEPVGLADGTGLAISISIGIAQGLGDGLSPAELMARADAALYESKRGGRNAFRVAA